MLSATVKPASSRTPATRGFLQCLVTLFLFSLGLMQSGCAVMETYMVPMRDGTLLATDVYLPSSNNDSWPVLLIRTPYGRDENEALFDFAEDYALVIQDVRGRYDSEGDYHPFIDDGWGEKQDGYDTAAWILEQPWCNGKIGTFGASADGITQQLLAGSAPPSPGITCQFIRFAPTDLYSQIVFQGGAFLEALVTGWLEGQGASAWVETFKQHPSYDSFWELGNVETKAEFISAPAVHVGGWYDMALKGSINGFLTRQAEGIGPARGNQRLLIGPWTHGGINTTLQGELEYPDEAVLDQKRLFERWIDYWLRDKETGIMDSLPVVYYVMNESPGNEWREAQTWPPFVAAPTPYYLQPEGVLAPGEAAAGNASSTYVFDPENPVPTRGGLNLTIDAGPYDQSSLESRADVLLFSTAPLAQPLEMTGDLKAILYVSSDASDTDFTAKLTDVYPDGRSMLIADGIIRARYRNSLSRPELMAPGAVYRIEIDLWATSIIINTGHRIRLAVSSSNYPRFDVNPNTGGDTFDKGTMIKATNTIYYNSTYPSHILLPVVSR
jgi:predicted acyl esterase